MDFMRTAEIRTEYFFFVLTCGDRFDIALGHAEQAAQTRGWDLKYADGVKMVYNYLPMYDMQEEVAKLPQKDVEEQINRVCANICDRKEQRVVVNEELRTQMELYHNNYALKIMKKDTALTYTMNDSCVRCAIPPARKSSPASISSRQRATPRATASSFWSTMDSTTCSTATSPTATLP